MSLRVDPLRLALASDHAGFEMKAALVDWLKTKGHIVEDLGPGDTASVDYPDYGYALADAIVEQRAEFGIAICGSGIGIAIAVNREPRARCALVHEPHSAGLARSHNDANVIALGARLIGIDMAKACIDAFLTTHFLGDRHTPRVMKLGQPHFAKESV
jgi:ribose 5-phosphate isomerase B